MASMDIINIVYGDDYTKLFIDVSLPSQLSPGNIPSIRDRASSIYRIITTEADAATIKASPAFEILSSHIPVKFDILSPEGIRDPDFRKANGINVYKVMMEVQKNVMRKSPCEYLMFPSPDTIVSDGTYSNIEKRLDEGYEVILLCGLRMSLESAMPWLRQYLISDTLIMNSRTLVSGVLRYPHPWTQSTIHPITWEVDVHLSDWPSLLSWREDRIGLICHCFHLHPIAVKRSYGNEDFSVSIDTDYLSRLQPGSDKVYVATDSDEICIMELSPHDHSVCGHITGQQFGLFFLSRWIAENANPVNQWFATIPLVYKSANCQAQLVEQACRITTRAVQRAIAVCKAM
jgi:hypothetical protein